MKTFKSIFMFVILSALMACNQNAKDSENSDNSENDSILVETAIIPSDIISLPDADFQKDISFFETLENRKSERNYNPDVELTAEELSNLLWAACGINREDGGKTAPLLWDMHMYVAMKHGVYKFDEAENVLNRISEEDIRAEISTDQEFAKDAPVILILTLNLADMTDEWIAETGGKMFYAGNQVGHVSQNIYLSAAAMDLSTVAMSWFNNDVVNEKLGLEDEQKSFLIQPVAKKF